MDNDIMGGTCSAQRRRSHRERADPREPARQSDGRNWTVSDMNEAALVQRRTSRHSVVAPLPDESVDTIYAQVAEFTTSTVTVTAHHNGSSHCHKNTSRSATAHRKVGAADDSPTTRQQIRYSPKSLADLCVDTICRSLPYLDGALPEGLPQEVVDSILLSLIHNSALNLTTLKTLRNCDFTALQLSKCRGVSDTWLAYLRKTRQDQAATYNVPAVLSPNAGTDVNMTNADPSDMVTDANNSNNHEIDDVDSCISGNESFQSAHSSHRGIVMAADTPPPHSEISIHRNSINRHRACDRDAFHECQMLSHGDDDDDDDDGSMSMTKLLDLRGSNEVTDDGLVNLSRLRRLEIALFDNCYSITGHGLGILRHSHALTTLSLANCRRLTDAGLTSIAHLESITSLVLQGCRCITDRGIGAIAGLHGLRNLDLSECDLLTDDALCHLSGMTTLESLSLGWCRMVTDAGVNTLTLQRGRDVDLKSLRLARCPVSDDGIRYLRRLNVLEKLDLNGCSNIGSAVLGVTLGELRHLQHIDVGHCPGILRTSWQGKIPALKSLQLCYSAVRDTHILRQYTLPALEELNLDSCLISDRALKHLAENDVAPKLCSLNLADTEISDLGMRYIGQMKGLKRLSLFFCNITEVGVRHLQGLTSLEMLNLDGREINDDCIRYIEKLPNLRSLDIFSGRIGDSGCYRIARIKSLESLELCGGSVGDLGCSILATLENLQTLNLAQNERITNRGAASLAALKNLKALNLSSTQVNTNGLQYLSNLGHLQSIALYGCRSARGGCSVTRFQNSLPKLRCLRSNHYCDEDGTMADGSHLRAPSTQRVAYTSSEQYWSDDEEEEIGDGDDSYDDDDTAPSDTMDLDDDDDDGGSSNSEQDDDDESV